MAVKGPTSDHGEILSWAQSNAAVPVEVLPAIVDSVPPLLQLMRKERITQRGKIRIISWGGLLREVRRTGTQPGL